MIRAALTSAVIILAVSFAFQAQLGAVVFDPLLWSLSFSAALATWAAIARAIPRDRGPWWLRGRLAALCLAPLILINYKWLAFATVHAPTVLFLLCESLAVGGFVGLCGHFWLLDALLRLPQRLRAAVVSPAAIWVLAGLWAAGCTAMCVHRWWGMSLLTQDLAIYCQSVYNTLHGSFLSYTTDLRLPAQPVCRLGDHFEPLVLAFVPLWALCPSAVWFLVAQVALLAWGAIPVAGIARLWCRSSFAALCFAFAYLMFPGFQVALESEFHMEVLAAPFVLWGIWLALRRRRLLSVLAFVLAMACKENIPATVFVAGLWLAWRHDRRFGIAVSALALVWFALALGVIIPHFSPTGQYLYGGLLHSRQAAAVMSHNWRGVAPFASSRLDQILYLAGPVSGLCFLAPTLLALSAPELVLHLLSANPLMSVLGGHYQVTVCIGYILGGIGGMTWLIRAVSRRMNSAVPDDPRPRQLLLMGFLAASVVFALNTTTLLTEFSWSWFASQKPDVQATHRLLALIPDDAPVSVSSPALATHLSRRKLLILESARSLATIPATHLSRVRYLVFATREAQFSAGRFQAKYGLRLIGRAGETWAWETPWPVTGAQEPAPTPPSASPAPAPGAR